MPAVLKREKPDRPPTRCQPGESARLSPAAGPPTALEGGIAVTGILRTIVFAALLPGTAWAAGAAAPWDTGQVKPSGNAGKRGAYKCTTDNPTYRYDVYVPSSYSDQNPAGLHIFFHGQGKPSESLTFGRWKDTFLEQFNLIGINMRYMDGDNAKDTGGKVAAAEYAIAQTCADYKVVLGRGVVSSFSGGGLPHGRLLTSRAKGPGASGWPFNHSASYDSNLWVSAAGAKPMSWFIGLGGREWNMGKPTLGSTQPRRAHEVLTEAVKKDGLADVYLRIEPEKAHSISRADVQASAEQFRRSDIALAPFIYAPDFEERELAPIVRAANTRALGRAYEAIERLLNRSSTKGEIREKAERVKAMIEQRICDVLELAGALAEKDPVLTVSYGKRFLQQLAGHPRAAELRRMLSRKNKSKEFRDALRVFPIFVEKFSGFFGGGPNLQKEAVPLLEQIEKLTLACSLTGRMTREFLKMKSPHGG